jgi:uncharacterized repeat protein (TIGR02543 family)
VYDEEADGATFSWSYAALATGNTVDDNLDIFSQKLNVYDELGELLMSIPVTTPTTTYILTSPLLEPNKIYSVELEVVGTDGYTETDDKTIDYAYVDLETIIDEPVNVTPPTLTLQSGTANKTGSTYRLSSGEWTNEPTEFRYQLELNNEAGTVLAYYPSSTGYTSETYFDYQFTSPTTSTVSGSVIASNGADSLPAYSNSIGPITQLQYTITYEELGGTVVSDDIVNAGSSVFLPTTSRQGYIFNGWYTEPLGGGTYVGGGGPTPTSYTPTESITLYASWTGIEYTVTWNKNDGTSDFTSDTVISGTTIYAPTPSSREHYNFTRWRNPQSGGDPIFLNAGDAWIVTYSFQFYAQWVAKTYTVTFNYGSGTGTPATRSVQYPGTVTLPTPDSNADYIFNGWYTGPNATGTFVGGSGPTPTQYQPTSNITLYADYTIAQRTITWNANGGTGGGTTGPFNAGTAHTAPSPGTRANYAFLYWRDSISGDYAFQVADGGTFIPPYSGMTFYARWSLNQYTVSYNGNGGTPTRTSDIVNAGSSITLPSASRDGYVLDGWYTAATGGT